MYFSRETFFFKKSEFMPLKTW